MQIRSTGMIHQQTANSLYEASTTNNTHSKTPPGKVGAVELIFQLSLLPERQCLRLCYLAALDAVSANANALGSAVDQGANSLQIDAPTTPSDVVGVRNVVTKLRAFAAYVAYLCHCADSKILKGCP